MLGDVLLYVGISTFDGRQDPLFKAVSFYFATEVSDIVDRYIFNNKIR